MRCKWLESVCEIKFWRSICDEIVLRSLSVRSLVTWRHPLSRMSTGDKLECQPEWEKELWQWRRRAVQSWHDWRCRHLPPLPPSSCSSKSLLTLGDCQRQPPESCWVSGLVGYGRDQDLHCPQSPLGFPALGDSNRSLPFVVIIDLYSRRLFSVSFRLCRLQESGSLIAGSIQPNPRFNKTSLPEKPQYLRDFCPHQSSARHRRMSLLCARFLLSPNQKESHYSLPSDCCWFLPPCQWVYLLPLENWSTSFLRPILWGYFLYIYCFVIKILYSKYHLMFLFGKPQASFYSSSL